MSVAAVVPAAGSGSRLGGGRPKALRMLGGQTLVERAVASLRAGGAGAVVVAAPGPFVAEVRALLPGVEVVTGGATREQSVRAALAALAEDVDVVLVHDAARALAPPSLVARVVAAVRDGAGAVVPLLAMADTIRQVDESGHVVGTVDRARLRAVQTPQGFRRRLLDAAYAAVAAADSTDDASLVERLGHEVQAVEGDPAAFKVTTPFDLRVAAALLRSEGGPDV